MAKSEYTDLTYFMIYGYKLVKNSDHIVFLFVVAKVLSFLTLTKVINGRCINSLLFCMNCATDTSQQECCPL